MLRLIPPWAYGIAALIALTGAFGAGFKVASWRCESDKLAEVQRAIKRAEEARAKVHEESTNYENDREQSRQQAEQREGRVREIYRTVEVPASCEPPAAAGSLLDDAIRGANARAGSEPSG